MRVGGSAFDRLSVRSKIMLGYGVFAAPFLVLIAVVWVTTTRTEREIAFVQNDTIPFIRSVEEIRLAGLRLIAETGSYAMLEMYAHGRAGETGEGAPEATTSEGSGHALAGAEKEEMLEARRRLVEARQAFERLQHRDHGDVSHVHEALLRSIDVIDGGSRAIENLVARHVDGETLLERLDGLNDSEEEFVEVTGQALESETTEQREHGDWLSTTMAVSRAIIAGLVLFGIAAIIAGVMLVAGRIARPIRRLSEQARLVGQGDFDALDRTTTGGEVGVLTAAIGTMVDNLRAMIDKMGRQQKLSALGQLAGTVGHDLRNPLAAIRTSLHTLRQMDQNKGFGIVRPLDRMERSVDRCSAIVSDLLDFTRVRDLEREATALDQWLPELLDEHKLADGVALRREIAAGVEALIDRDRFRRVMINLIDNAAQAMTSQGWSAPADREPTVTVGAEAAGPHVRVTVSDNGPGIGAESLAKIFEPLFTTKSSGVGLGLPIVRQIVEQHGGTIDVESRVEVGTTFTIFLPRRESGQQPAPAAGAAYAAA